MWNLCMKHAFELLEHSQIGLIINALELQSSDLTAAQRRVAELTARVAELEETLSKAQKEVIKLQDTSAKLQQDLMENVAQKEDQVFFFIIYNKADFNCCILRRSE